MHSFGLQSRLYQYITSGSDFNRRFIIGRGIAVLVAGDSV